MISICKASATGLHEYEWEHTQAGKGQWRCRLQDCGHTEGDETGHDGGYALLETLMSLALGIVIIGAIAVAAWMDTHKTKKYEIWTKGGTVYAE